MKKKNLNWGNVGAYLDERAPDEAVKAIEFDKKVKREIEQGRVKMAIDAGKEDRARRQQLATAVSEIRQALR